MPTFVHADACEAFDSQNRSAATPGKGMTTPPESAERSSAQQGIRYDVGLTAATLAIALDNIAARRRRIAA